MSGVLDTRPVGPDDVADLARLFGTERNTRRCWCMAFCTTRGQFAVGWLGGGNRRRFEALAAGPSPMGVLAFDDGEPVGWCACGPRSRYLLAASPMLAHRDPDEDEDVWLLPCLFVRAGHRGQAVSHTLVGAAVESARRHGATAAEGWPLAASVDRPGEAFLGRQQVFAELGFREVDRPSADRVVMRLELR